MSIQGPQVGNLGKIFSDGLGNLGSKSADLQSKMNQVLSKETIDQGEMLELQFQMGQYNAAMESLSNVTKSLTDMLKTLAQRTG